MSRPIKEPRDGGPRLTKSPARRAALSDDDYVNGVCARDRAALGRAFTLLESRRPEHREQAERVLRRLAPLAGGAVRIGVSGAPGVGKSTLIEHLGLHLIEQGRLVAVLAIDPSSEVSGGSILGDKTRMEGLSHADRALVRPSSSGGRLGGVERHTREAILVCEAAGFDVVIVETVGVGQSETEVASMTDFFLLLLLAGAGDELQGIKRGVIELADAVAITKADGDNVAPARLARAEFEQALSLVRPAIAGWRPRALSCSARTGDGIASLWSTILEHRAVLDQSGRLADKRRQQTLRWFRESVDLLLKERLLNSPPAAAALALFESRVLDQELSPAEAARRAVDAILPLLRDSRSQ